jgi:hypothetical protein
MEGIVFQDRFKVAKTVLSGKQGHIFDIIDLQKTQKEEDGA